MSLPYLLFSLGIVVVVLGIGIVSGLLIHSRLSRGSSTPKATQPRQPPPTQFPTPPSELRHKDVYCSRCHAAYEEGDAFCKKCGLTLAAPETKTELATPTTTCPRCSTIVPTDVTFCPTCGSTLSLKGTTEPTVFVDTPLPPTRLKNSAMVNTQAETVAAMTTTRTCPSCHTTVQLGPEDKFCGNCGYTLV